MRVIITLLITLWALAGPERTMAQSEIARWQQQAGRITIIRDTWGVPHIYGKTDADVVFGVLYTQCEDDFERVEANYIDAIGRQAEVDGEAALYHDLRARLFMDSTQAVAIYRKSPPWMKQLLDAFADGANYFLHTHPNVKPKLINRFQPWMPLLFSEGSIGGNISVVSTERLKAFYTNNKFTSRVDNFDRNEREPVGSNGFAIAPAKSASGHALLLINPHTSFYFRSEVQMVSQAGLNAYGAVTWGQFFIYQGFNQHCGWMHTSSSADSMDEYLETVTQKNGKYYYQYGKEQRPVQTQTISLPYRQGDKLLRKTFTVFRTHHGPVAGQQGDKWITVRMMNDPLNAIMQSYLRTKATDYASFQKVMQLNGNASNNTVFADTKGTIAYWHGNFMPRRNPSFDWSQPVDGSDPQTEWQGLHGVNELVQVRNPASGWIQNCNATPFTVSGSSSPDRAKYPAYMAPDAENYRGVNAVRVLSRRSVFSLDTLIAAANDPYLSAFEPLIPALIAAYQATAGSGQRGDESKDLVEAIDTLRNWNKNYGKSSVATTLAIYWGERIQQLARGRLSPNQRMNQLTFTDFVLEKTSPQEKITALTDVMAELTRDFGRWRTPWGDVNRYQRLTGAIDEVFDDQKPSIPVGFPSAVWGALANFGARTHPNTKKRYGYVGNSFVAVVEFGPRIKARSVVTGGQDSRPSEPHFTDQAPLFCEGKFKEVRFYPEDVRQHAEKTYHPGREKANATPGRADR